MPTGIFLLTQYAGISALLCSRIDAANLPEKMGADFQLVENWVATAPLPDMFRLKGTFFRIDKRDEGLRAIRCRPECGWNLVAGSPIT